MTHLTGWPGQLNKFIYVKHFVPYLAHGPLISVFAKVLLVVHFPKASSNWYKTKRKNLLAHIIWLDQRLRGCHQEAVSPLLPPVHWLLSPTGSPLVKVEMARAPAAPGSHPTSSAPQQERTCFIPSSFSNKFRVASLHG